MTYQFTCEHCGEVFEKETKSRTRFCGKDCWEAGRGPLPGRSRDAVAGAMRASLKNQESGVKSAMLKHHREYACAVCGKPVDLKNGADLHHAIPVYVLFNTFLRERGITRPEVAAEQTRSIRHRRDRPFRFTDGEFASAWRRYHRFNRMLQVVHRRGCHAQANRESTAENWTDAVEVPSGWYVGHDARVVYCEAEKAGQRTLFEEAQSSSPDHRR